MVNQDVVSAWSAIWRVSIGPFSALKLLTPVSAVPAIANDDQQPKATPEGTTGLS